MENRGSFKARLVTAMAPDDVSDIMFAYDMAKASHKNLVRKDLTTRYFEHPRRVAIILIDDLGIMDKDLIIAALLHDVVEDTPTFGNIINDNFPELTKRAKILLTRIFGATVADYVMAMTKHSDWDLSQYMGPICENEKIVILKLADRFDNLRDSVTIKKSIDNFVERYLNETDEILELTAKFHEIESVSCLAKKIQIQTSILKNKELTHLSF